MMLFSGTGRVGKRVAFQNGYKTFLFLFGKILEYSELDITLYDIKTAHVTCTHFTIYNVKHTGVMAQW